MATYTDQELNEMAVLAIFNYYNGYYYICPLGCDYKNCPLEEVEDD